VSHKIIDLVPFLRPVLIMIVAWGVSLFFPEQSKSILEKLQFGIDAYKTGEDLLKKPESDDKNIARIHAAADLSRSLALLGGIENLFIFLYWATRGIVMVFAMVRVFETIFIRVDRWQHGVTRTQA